VVRSFSLLLAVCALAGCVTPEAEYGYRAPVVYGARTRPQPVGPTIYESAPRAPLHSALFACNGGGGSNIGEIGMDGEAVLYAPYIETPAGQLLRNPAEQACLSSGFGWRGSLGGGRPHNGLDLANPNGGFIYAAGDGRIRRAEYYGGYGNTIEIDHGNGVVTRYAHLSEINPNLQAGDRVAAGTPMARMGATGNATGVHLHYELWIADLLVDPLHYGRPPTMVSAPAPQDAFVTAPSETLASPPPEDSNY
jgi:murein DD-endopeptidase MepM/ murein hydrolase activator NlpD